MTRKIRMFDVTKCIGCRACQVACKDWNQLPASETRFTGTYENPPDLQPETWCRVKFNEHEENGRTKWFFTFYSCMHCKEPACLDICPVDAIKKTGQGAVNIDAETCISCGACITACPFDVPRISDVAWKCTFCSDRTTNELTPACAKVCPTGTITFGDAQEKIDQAMAEVENLKNKGVTQAQLYGVEEIGGLNAVYVLADTPEKYGLPANPEVSSAAYLWKMALGPVRTVATVGLVAGSLFHWYDLRRKEQEALKK